MSQTLQLFSADTFAATEADSQRLVLANDADPREVNLDGIQTIELQFPKFSDGRAFSQAVLRADQNLAHGQALLTHYPAFYQGDAVHTAPHFAAA